METQRATIISSVSVSTRMNRSVLVTGASGFVGPFMVARLREAGFRVTGTGDGPRSSQLPADLAWQSVDLTRPTDVKRLAREWWGVVHLASNSVPQSFRSTADTLGNVAMTLELLEHLEPCRFLFISSCQVYRPEAANLTEASATRPPGRYGMSKLLCEQAVLAHADRHDVRIARPFNHLGPGMVATLAIPSLIRRLCEEPESPAPLRMHGQNSVRDFIDVEDVTSAYLAIMRADEPRERVFNVCTGIPRSIGDVARAVLDLMGSRRTIEFENIKLSSDDSQRLVGDPSRLIDATGWRPTRSLEQSLETMLRHSRSDS
jgi:nucleoside-diphosphate-sugar epimerase